MTQYDIQISKRVQKDIDRLPEADRRNIVRRINELKDDPRPRTCKPLTGQHNGYRLRYRMYRIVYYVDDQQRTIVIDAVKNRNVVYRD